MVSIALQLPESEVRDAPNGRLIDKFPSNTTLWLVLRKFESGVAGSATTRNLTARGLPLTSSGSGRLFYESPVLNIMGKELLSFTDLQKTLAQLGFNNGSALLRLSFRLTDRPFEEAMVAITEYFHSVEEESENLQKKDSRMESDNEILTSKPEEPRATASEQATTTESEKSQPSPDPHPQPFTLENPPAMIVSSREATVYAPPSGPAPQATQHNFEEEDYIPTVDHAKSHQRNLKAFSRPSRLPTDAEIAAQKADQDIKLDSISEIEVKIRFPDQSQVVSKYGKQDTGSELYTFARSCLDSKYVNEKFSLIFFPNTRSKKPNTGRTVVPDTKDSLLIKDLYMDGRVLVNFLWDSIASVEARAANINVLRPELRSAASQIQVPEIASVPVENEVRLSQQDRKESANERSETLGGKRVPKWFKLGKK